MAESGHVESHQDNYPEGYHLIREALVREMRDAQRWSAIKDAWDALFKVRLMAQQMKEEADSFENINFQR